MKQRESVKDKTPECDCDKVLPMAKWLEEEKEDECRPCSVAVLIGNYQETLTEAGRRDLAGRFTATLEADTEDPVMDTAKLMDEIKGFVDEGLKKQLLSLDCMAQAEPAKNK